MKRCYEFHGYPPGYKPKQKSPTVAVNQVSNKPLSMNDRLDSLNDNSLKNLSIKQCYQIMTMLVNHLISLEVNEHHDKSSTSYMAGTCYSVSSKFDINPMKFWIIDSTVAQHICANINVFPIIDL